MNKKGHIKKAERLEIYILLNKGYSCRDIGMVLGRSHTSIGHEISSNAVHGEYDPYKADTKAKVRRKKSKYQGMKVRGKPAVEAYVKHYLKKGWTPEQIAGRLKETDTHIPYVSHMAIYKWLYSAWGQPYCEYLISQRARPRKRRKKKTKRTLIPNRVGIEKRPIEANNREVFGHFEGDTVVSGKRYGSTSITVVQERKARYAKLRKIHNLKPATNNRAIYSMTRKLKRFETFTLDNGVENTKHEKLAKKLDIAIYFCDPYSSWQKGGVENLNKLIRRFIPKGCDIAQFSHQQIAAIEDKLNNTPRKCLNYKTPYEVMIENNLLSTNEKPAPSGAIEGLM
jgi:transposase, IS30 family